MRRLIASEYGPVDPDERSPEWSRHHVQAAAVLPRQGGESFRWRRTVPLRLPRSRESAARSHHDTRDSRPTHSRDPRPAGLDTTEANRLRLRPSAEPELEPKRECGSERCTVPRRRRRADCRCRERHRPSPARSAGEVVPSPPWSSPAAVFQPLEPYPYLTIIQPPSDDSRNKEGRHEGGHHPYSGRKLSTP